MTGREDLIESAARALAPWDGLAPSVHRDMAAVVVAAVLPQITTAEQLDGYGDGTQLLDSDEPPELLTLESPYLVGRDDRPVDIQTWLDLVGPLTVVWQPRP